MNVVTVTLEDNSYTTINALSSINVLNPLSDEIKTITEQDYATLALSPKKFYSFISSEEILIVSGLKIKSLFFEKDN